VSTDCKLDLSGSLAQTSLKEGEDFYLDGAYMVFTAAYHERRGYCCDSGCRHCPFRDLSLPSELPGSRNEGTGIE
jgi:hypothetical protein